MIPARNPIRRRVLHGLPIAAAIAAIAAIAISASPSSAATTRTSATSIVDVRMGIGPYLDYMPWLVAHQLGVDAEFGLDIKTTTLQSPQLGGPQLRRGDLDVSYSCQACNFPILKAIPDLREWMITDQFKGFAVIGRTGSDTYDQVVKSGASGPSARKQILKSFIGKQFVMVGANYKSLLESAMTEVGLDPAGVKIVDFADDGKAALAFIQGTGDYYMGSLPQETKMLQTYSDKFLKVGGEDILGPGGLWYSSAIALQPWLDAHADTALRLMATWYRTMRYLREKPDVAVPLMAKYINDRSASKLSAATVKFLMTKLTAFSTLSEAKSLTFDPKSIDYNLKSVEFYGKANSKVLPSDYKSSTYFVSGTWFKKLSQRSDLLALINKPLH